jgi:hypothetical protein
LTYTLPSDQHLVGDNTPAGIHTTDHNRIVDVLKVGMGVNVQDSANSGGATGNGQYVGDGAMNSGSTTLTSASNKFAAGDVGKLIYVYGAGSSSGVLATTVASFTSPGSVNLTAANASGVNQTAMHVWWGTDDTTAIQAAVTAAANLNISYNPQDMAAPVYFPNAIYMTSSALTFPAPVSITGGGTGSVIFNGATDVFDFQNSYRRGMRFENLSIIAMGGDIFTNINLHRCTFKGLHMAQYAAGKSIMTMGSSGTGLSNVRFEDIHFTGYGAPLTGLRTVALWHIYFPGAKNVDVVTWRKCTFYWNPPAVVSSPDNTQFIWDIACTANTPGGIADRLTFDSCDGGSVLGGLIRCLSCQGVNIYQPGTGNIYNGQGNSLTVGNSMIYIGNYTSPTSFSYTSTSASPAVFTATASNYAAGTTVILSGGAPGGGFSNGVVYYVAASPAPTANTFSLAATSGGTAINSTSTGSGTVAACNPASAGGKGTTIIGYSHESSGTVTWGTFADIELDPVTDDTVIIAPHSTDTTANGNVLRVNVNGSTNAVLVNPRAGYTLLNAGGDTTVYDGGDVLIGGVSAVSGDQQPAVAALLGWNLDPANCQAAGSITTSGSVYCMRIDVYKPVTAGHLWFYITVAGSGITAAENFVGLYNSSGTLLASAGIDSNMTSTGTQKVAITAQALTPGTYFVAFLGVATTMPTLLRSTSAIAAYNIGTSAATLRAGTLATGQTSLPSPATLSGLVNGTAAPWWAGLAA